MRYIFAIIIALSLAGCAVTWTTIGVAAATMVTVAEDVGGVVKMYKDAKDYLLDNNTTED